MKTEKIAFRSPVNLPRTNRPSIELRPDSLPKQSFNNQPRKLNGKSKQQIWSGKSNMPNSQQLYLNEGTHKSIQSTLNPSAVKNEQDIQKIIQNYQMKMRLMAEEFHRGKQEMDKKLSQVSRERNHWQQIAQRVPTSPPTTDNKDYGNKEYLQKLEQEKQKLNKEKEELQKQITRISTQNFKLRQTVNNIPQFNNQVRSKYTSQPIHANNRNMGQEMMAPNEAANNNKIVPPKIKINTVNAPAPVHPQINKEAEALKHSNEKLQNLVQDLNSDIFTLKLQSLNRKYEHMFKRENI